MRVQRIVSVVAFLIILAALVSAQMSNGWGNVRVHIIYKNDRRAPMHLLVRLLAGSSSSQVTDGYTNESGVVVFDHVSVGTYHLEVSGDGIRKVESEQFEVDSRKISQTQFVTVERTDDGNSAGSGSATVSAKDFAIPERARREFDMAAEAMIRQEWKRAEGHLNKAIAIYPSYAAAYNNLGVVYGKLNEPAHERAALQRAVSVDDHFASAYVNLATLAIRQQDFEGAQAFLEKAVPLNPNDTHALLLLANVQLLNKNFDAAIATVGRIHSLPHPNLAVAHYIAARAYERENRLPEAKAELLVFLEEEPKGERADHVRDELKLVDQHLH